MASVTVNIERNDHIADFPAVFAELGQQYMTLAVNVVQGAVQRNAPVNMGTYRAGISNTVQLLGEQVKGSVFSGDDPIKVAVIEEGRRPGRFAPVDVITRWVQLVIRPALNMLRSVSFLVNRAIATRGIPGKHVFQKAFEQTQGEVNQILSVDLPEALARRI